MKSLGYVLGAVVLAVTLQGGMASAADEYVVHKFDCPLNTTVKFNWANKIHANPDFPVHPGYENSTHQSPFKASTFNPSENTVSCIYRIGQWEVPYVYKVHRKILGCSGIPYHVFTCKLKPG